MSITSASDPVDAIVDILNATDTAEWTFSKPEIYRHDEVSSKDRENNQDDAVYVRSLATMELDRFSADNAEQTEDGQVQVLVYSYDANRSNQHARDIVEFLQSLMNDNYDQTGFLSVEPTGLADNRAAKVTRQTRHYIYLVEVETHRLN
jgi:hypothetical protein